MRLAAVTGVHAKLRSQRVIDRDHDWHLPNIKRTYANFTFFVIGSYIKELFLLASDIKFHYTSMRPVRIIRSVSYDSPSVCGTATTTSAEWARREPSAPNVDRYNPSSSITCRV